MRVGCKLTGHGNSLASAIEVHDSSVTVRLGEKHSLRKRGRNANYGQTKDQP